MVTLQISHGQKLFKLPYHDKVNGAFALIMLERLVRNQEALKLPSKDNFWAVVVAQLAEQSAPKPEDLGSNPTIDDNIYLLLTVEKGKVLKKRLGILKNGPQKTTLVVSLINWQTCGISSTNYLCKKDYKRSICTFISQNKCT